MKKIKLMKEAAEAYGDGICTLDGFFNPKTGEFVKKSGDGLASFIVAELSETFDPAARTPAQYQEAIRVLEIARGQIERVAWALWLRSGCAAREQFATVKAKKKSAPKKINGIRPLRPYTATEALRVIRKEYGTAVVKDRNELFAQAAAKRSNSAHMEFPSPGAYDNHCAMCGSVTAPTADPAYHPECYIK